MEDSINNEVVVDIDELDGLLQVMRIQIADLKPGSEEHTNMVASYEKLLKARNSFDRDEFDRQVKLEEVRADKSDKKKDRWIKIVLGALQIGLPLGVYMKLVNKGFEFEKDGVVTSLTMRNLLGKLNPMNSLRK